MVTVTYREMKIFEHLGIYLWGVLFSRDDSTSVVVSQVFLPGQAEAAWLSPVTPWHS